MPRRALLLENDEALAEAIVEALRDSGWHVAHARSIVEARRAIDRGELDVVLVDLALAGERGRHLLDDVATFERLPAMLVVSGHPNARAIAHEFGIGFVPKPFDLAHLVAAMETAIEWKIRPRRGASGARWRLDLPSPIDTEEVTPTPTGTKRD